VMRAMARAIVQIVKVLGGPMSIVRWIVASVAGLLSVWNVSAAGDLSNMSPEWRFIFRGGGCE
jgi:hypothetical protein